ncbi:MAG: alpha/beta fold hydrolase [Candidatus Omnitrophica bacterium]|nr:alpha/beta fold hydrolase [Candidatus Omnitrophota bacterium]
MISLRSKFKLINRGFKKTLVLIPGWATDFRIFAALDLKFNYLMPIKFCPFYFKKNLINFLNKKSIKKVSLFGWSMGGFLACDFASEYPDRIGQLILLSVRRSFKRKALKEIELKIKQNKKAYLYKFYLDCFSSEDKEGLNWFRKHLLKVYLNQMPSEELLSGLDYLTRAKINPESLSRIKRITFFHGKEDRIAPINEVRQIKSGLAKSEFICADGLGHILFLNHKFKDKFYHG